LLARTEALDEVEAAAEQRFAAALARERAQLAKQARCLLCMFSIWLQRASLCCRQCMRQTVSETAGHALHVAELGSMGHSVVELSWRPACFTVTCHALLTERCPLWPGAPSARRGARRGRGGSRAAAGRAGPGAPRGEGGRRARGPGAGRPAGARSPADWHASSCATSRHTVH